MVVGAVVDSIHTRSDVAVGAIIWYWVGKQVVIVLQTRLEVAVWGETWYSTPNSQRMVKVDEGVTVVSETQTRSVV